MTTSEDVRRLSDELARDPASRVFVPLGDALRQQGQLDLALKVTLRGLERHPHLAEGHDLLARIAVDRGDLQRAFDEWDMTLRLAPAHLGALKGLGFVSYQRGQLGEAHEYLARAAALDGGDEQVSAALARLRAPGAETSPPATTAALPAGTSHDPRFLFVDVLIEGDQTALLLDDGGLVLAGAYVAWDGRDVASEVGAELSGVSEAAHRATHHLGLGAWTSIVFETEAAVVAMAPTAQDGLLLLATSRSTPLGLVRRLLDRCVDRARRWLGGRLA